MSSTSWDWGQGTRHCGLQSPRSCPHPLRLLRSRHPRPPPHLRIPPVGTRAPRIGGHPATNTSASPSGSHRTASGDSSGRPASASLSLPRPPNSPDPRLRLSRRYSTVRRPVISDSSFAVATSPRAVERPETGQHHRHPRRRRSVFTGSSSTQGSLSGGGGGASPARRSPTTSSEACSSRSGGPLGSARARYEALSAFSASFAGLARRLRMGPSSSASGSWPTAPATRMYSFTKMSIQATKAAGRARK
jgi:hypothetical protein